MSKHTYHPDRGDVIHVNFSPAAGREFAGPHFAIVISTIQFSRATGLCIVLPTTTKYHHDQRFADANLMVRLPDLPDLRQEGWAYTHQIKTIDYRARDASFVGKVPDDFLIDIMDRSRTLIDPDSVV